MPLHACLWPDACRSEVETDHISLTTGGDIEWGGGLLQDQKEHEAQQTAGRIRKQSGQGRAEHPVRSIFYLCSPLDGWSGDLVVKTRLTSFLLPNTRFLYDGDRITDDDTPNSLAMDDNGTR